VPVTSRLRDSRCEMNRRRRRRLPVRAEAVTAHTGTPNPDFRYA
jgi:hypothetical protein